MPETDTTSKWLSSVPEIHYDLIARTMPGTLTLVMGVILYRSVEGQDIFDCMISPTSPTSSIGSGFVFLVFATVLSWCTGMLLTPMGCSIHALLFRAPAFRKFYREHNETLDNAVTCKFLSPPKVCKDWKSYNGENIDEQAEITYQELHDSLKEVLPVAKVNLAKSQAERVFYECSTAGLLILIAVWIFLAVQAHSQQPFIVLSQPAFSLICALIILMLSLSLWGQWFKANRVWLRQASLLIIYLKQPNQQKTLQKAAIDKSGQGNGVPTPDRVTVASKNKS
jgi:hypothetical protein